MSTITTNSNSAAASGASAAAAQSRAAAPSMGQSDFLRLMTTQLTTQDPFNPMDNTQMVAQMAQFSQVAGIAEMNASLAKMAAASGGSRFSDASSWIGRNMLVQSPTASPLSDGSYGGEIALPKDADQVTLSLVDEKGTVVHSENLGARKAGVVQFAWDGRDQNGQVAASGPLRIVVGARAGSETVTASTASWTLISGIQSPASGADSRLVTGLGLLTADAAIRLA